MRIMLLNGYQQRTHPSLPKDSKYWREASRCLSSQVIPGYFAEEACESGTSLNRWKVLEASRVSVLWEFSMLKLCLLRWFFGKGEPPFWPFSHWLAGLRTCSGYIGRYVERWPGHFGWRKGKLKVSEGHDKRQTRRSDYKWVTCTRLKNLGLILSARLQESYVNLKN